MTRKKSQEHPEDVFDRHMDRALDVCLKELAPYIDKTVPFYNGNGHGEGAYTNTVCTPKVLAEKMIACLTTHLEVELNQIRTGEDDSGAKITGASNPTLYRLMSKRQQQAARKIRKALYEVDEGGSIGYYCLTCLVRVFGNDVNAEEFPAAPNGKHCDECVAFVAGIHPDTVME